MGEPDPPRVPAEQSANPRRDVDPGHPSGREDHPPVAGTVPLPHTPFPGCHWPRKPTGQTCRACRPRSTKNDRYRSVDRPLQRPEQPSHLRPDSPSHSSLRPARNPTASRPSPTAAAAAKPSPAWVDPPAAGRPAGAQAGPPEPRPVVHLIPPDHLSPLGRTAVRVRVGQQHNTGAVVGSPIGLNSGASGAVQVSTISRGRFNKWDNSHSKWSIGYSIENPGGIPRS